ncbi:MAG: epoxyqueuosine reductase QueH [Coriobacteriia bacterium]|nr:epoxyqueuosine reductase QueH [Coriobacteriia bacterium]
MDKLLLHSCCAPCANQPIDLLIDAGYEVHVLFANSNIHYLAEYQRRRDCLSNYLSSLGVLMYETAYKSGDWFQAIRNDGGVYPVLGQDADQDALMLAKRQTRCRLCYRFRMRQLADEAVGQGIGTIATTLSISPYQYQEILFDELFIAADMHGLQAVLEDWRPFYQSGQTKAKELGFYRQNYCGCEFSRQEAALERAARKARQASA